MDVLIGALETSKEWFSNVSTWMEADRAITNDKLYDLVIIPGEVKDGLFNVTIARPDAEFLYPFAFENDFRDGGPWSIWARENMHLPFIFVALYVTTVFGGKAWMKGRDAFKLRKYWILWNALLSAFSWCGALRMIPHLVLLVQERSFFTSYCGTSAQTYGWGQASGLWTVLFIFSKVPELFDTHFIIFSKSKLHFIQWYHHITVLLYTWHSYATRSGAGIWFITMNYTVHAVMYMYFALMLVTSEQKSRAYKLEDGEAKSKALRAVGRFRGRLGFFAPLITVMQITQMAVGVTIMCLIMRDSSAFFGDLACFVRRSSVVYGLGMYFSYLCLFVWFGVQKYFCTQKSHKD